MGNVIRRKLLLLFAAILVCTAAFGGFTAFLVADRAKNTAPDERAMRLRLNGLVTAAENGTISEISTERYVLFTLDGTVAAQNGTSYRTGEKIDLRTLSGLTQKTAGGETVDFVSPVIRGGTQTGTLVVTVNQKDYQPQTARTVPLLFVVLLFVCAVFILTFVILATIKNDLLAPAEILHSATKNILRGDLSTKLRYDYDGEMGRLCHDFETMRDELCISAKREKQMVEREKLLLACISHDLKTPLAAISGYVEEIRDGIADTREKINRYSAIILKKVQNLSKLIDDILDLSKTELNEFSIEKQEVYAKAYFSEALGDLSLDAARYGLLFRAGEIPDVLLEIDRKRISQVLWNILSNSIKYTSKGGEVNVSFTVSGRKLIVSLADTGEGIAAADLPFVFDKFYRGEKARTQNIPGSGLGLAIAKYIVQMHGGRIECDSVLGAGTTISFSLPLL